MADLDEMAENSEADSHDEMDESINQSERENDIEIRRNVIARKHVRIGNLKVMS